MAIRSNIGAQLDLWRKRRKKRRGKDRCRGLTRKARFRNVGAGKGVKDQLDEATLTRLYVDEGLTQTVIAGRYHCTPQFVSLLVSEYGLRRSPRQAEKSH